MRAGRDIDALIEEMVFKRKVEWREAGSIRFPVRVIGSDGHTEYDDIPHYSTDFQAAIPILKHMGKDGLSYTFQGGDGLHEVIFFSTELDDWSEEAVANTASLAICLAALKVMKVSL